VHCFWRSIALKGFEHQFGSGVVLDEKIQPVSVDRRHEADTSTAGIQGDGAYGPTGDSAKQSRTVDGRSLDATTYSPLDIISSTARSAGYPLRPGDDESSGATGVVKQQPRSSRSSESDGRTNVRDR